MWRNGEGVEDNGAKIIFYRPWRNDTGLAKSAARAMSPHVAAPGPGLSTRHHVMHVVCRGGSARRAGYYCNTGWPRNARRHAIIVILSVHYLSLHYYLQATVLWQQNPIATRRVSSWCLPLSIGQSQITTSYSDVDPRPLSPLVKFYSRRKYLFLLAENSVTFSFVMNNKKRVYIFHFHRDKQRTITYIFGRYA